MRSRVQASVGLPIRIGKLFWRYDEEEEEEELELRRRCFTMVGWGGGACVRSVGSVCERGKATDA
jgi:hypothetical protein